ncbi:MAG: RDD family protein [Mycobacteriales bacterium]
MDAATESPSSRPESPSSRPERPESPSSRPERPESPSSRPERPESPSSRLRLPATGSGSPAPLGRRLGALMLDGALCVLVASAYRGFHWESQHYLNVVVLFVEYLILLPLGGQTLGMWLTRIRVVSTTGARLSPRWVALRTVLLFLLVPAVVLDRDRRGLHDRASGTVVICV